MAQWHLDDLKNALSRKGWKIVSELDGNDYNISGSWEIQRSTKKPVLHIDFEGLDDMQTLSVPQAYACHLREACRVGLYFSKQKTWGERLKAFVAALDKMEDDLESAKE